MGLPPEGALYICLLSLPEAGGGGENLGKGLRVCPMPHTLTINPDEFGCLWTPKHCPQPLVTEKRENLRVIVGLKLCFVNERKKKDRSIKSFILTLQPSQAPGA